MIFNRAVAGLDGRRVSAVSFFRDDSDCTCGTCKVDLFQCTCRKDRKHFELMLAEAHTLMAKNKTIDLEEAYLQALDNQLGYITRAEIDAWSNPVSEASSNSDDAEAVADEDSEEEEASVSVSPWFMYDDDDAAVVNMRRVAQARQKKADRSEGGDEYNNGSWKCATNHPRKAWGWHSERIESKQARRQEAIEMQRKTFAENRFRLRNASLVEFACADLYKNGRDYSYGASKAARIQIAKVLHDKVAFAEFWNGTQDVNDSKDSPRKQNKIGKPNSMSQLSSISDLALMVHSKTEADFESVEVALMKQEREDAMIADAEKACSAFTGTVQLTEEEENHARWNDQVSTPVLVSNLGDNSQILELPEGRERYWGGEWNIRNKPEVESDLISIDRVLREDDDCPEIRPDDNDAPWRTVVSYVN